jgi:hypothetical protein
LPQPDELKQVAGVVLVSETAETSNLGEWQWLRQNADHLPPVLHLCCPGSRNDNRAPAGVEEIAYPVSIKRLSLFTRSLKKAA